MRKIVFRASIVCLFGSLLSCNEGSFTGRTGTAKPATPKKHVVTVMGMDPMLQGGQKVVQSIDAVDFVIQAGDNRVLSEQVNTKKQPVDLYFVLDSTASMTNELEAVKNGIVTLTENLKQAQIDLRAGLVGFVDAFSSVDERILQLTPDMATFNNFMMNYKLEGNSDYPEASLYATQKAIELHESDRTNSDAIKAILLITDVVGHNGASKPAEKEEEDRDCSINALVDKANAYATSLRDPTYFKFFFDVPESSRVTGEDREGAVHECGGFNIKSQMDAVYTAINPTVPQEKRGGPLLDSSGQMVWPLTESNFVSTLSSMLSESVDRQVMDGSCLATKAEVYEGSRVIYSWAPPSMEAVVNLSQSTNQLPLINVLQTERAKGTQNLELRIDRCCVSRDDLLRKQYSTCQKSYLQTIRYDIVNN